MERGLAAGTDARRITSIKAVINHVILEGRAKGLENYFQNLRVPSAFEKTGKELREALSIEEIEKVNQAVLEKNVDVQDIWTILTFSGARVAEISGLHWDNVYLKDNAPHLYIRPNSIRSTKTKSSRRKAPLTGAALEVLK